MPQDPESSEITTHPPAAQITAALVQPPSRVYITRDDRLYIRSRNSLTAVTLTVAGRLLTAAGEIVPFNFTHVPATNRTASLESFNLAEGFLLSVVVFPAVGAPLRGQTFVEIGLLRGLTVAAAVVDVLAKDYVAENEPVAFPGSPIRSSVEGPGVIRSVLGTDQAAGTELSETVPTDARWRFISLTTTYVADANAATRRVRWLVDDGTTTFFQQNTNGTQLASQTRLYTFASLGQSISLLNAHFTINAPNDVRLLAGFRILTDTVNFQVGDNWGPPQLFVEEWIED